jgi:hypothetical protein
MDERIKNLLLKKGKTVDLFTGTKNALAESLIESYITDVRK